MGTVSDTTATKMHIVLRVTIDAEDYALDLAGAQHNIHQIVMPWNAYLQKQAAHIQQRQVFGTIYRALDVDWGLGHAPNSQVRSLLMQAQHKIRKALATQMLLHLSGTHLKPHNVVMTKWLGKSRDIFDRDLLGTFFDQMCSTLNVDGLIDKHALAVDYNAISRESARMYGGPSTNKFHPANLARSASSLGPSSAERKAPTSEAQCAVCRRPTALVCRRCKEDIDGNGTAEGMPDTSYCSNERQITHWPDHKSECTKIMNRK
jgi:hypothetical protein